MVGTKWQPSNTIYEISKLIPEFISEVLVLEASELRKFIGRFNLGDKYFLNEYYGVFDVWKFEDIGNLFIDYNQPQTEGEEKSLIRYLVVSDTAFMVSEPIPSSNQIICRGWNTLYRLHKIRRELESPHIVTFVWDDDNLKEWIMKFDDPDKFISNITFRMEILG